jgi:hypothetical protein
MLKRIALFKRLPMLFWRPRKDNQIVAPEIQNNYPDFKADFDVLEQNLLPYFRELDNEALRAQNQFRRQQIILIVGGVIASTLGAVQAALSEAKWPGISEAGLTAFLTMVAFFARELNAQKHYFANRLKAETLRGEYFLFLGRMGSYANDADRVPNLIRRVADIESEEK